MNNMLPTRLFRFFDRRPAAVPLQTEVAEERRSYVTSQNVIKIDKSSLTVTKLGGNGESPWLTLLIAANPDDASGRSTGVVRLVRDALPLTLCNFDPLRVDELQKARVEFEHAKANLLAELGPPNSQSVGMAASASSARSASSGVVRPLGYFLAGGVSVIVLALLFGPQPPVQAGRVPVLDIPGAPGIGAPGGLPSAQLSTSQAPAAWNALPEEQKQVLMAQAQRVANALAAPGPAEQASSPGAPGANLPFSDVAELVRSMEGMTPVPGSLGGNGRPTAGVQGGTLTPEDFERVKKTAQLRFSDSGTAFWGFVDPMCSACRDLEAQLQSIDKRFSFVAVPVGFQGGGRDQAAAALCATDKLAAWHKAARVQFVGNTPCEEGYRQVDANNKLFLSLGFSATPTLVAPNGRWAKGGVNVTDDVVTLARWVEANRASPSKP